MNRAALKPYAPQARRDLIAAVTARANLLGLSSTSVSSALVRGDVAIIDGREWPAKVSKQRDALIARIKKDGFEQTMEAVAYTWFNRFAALRYMEIHDYLDHGYRVLSSRDGGLPEALRHASDLNLSSLDKAEVLEMQLAGNRDGDLYRKILLAECNELSRAMPFLFERIGDETELLLPDNLLRTDSVVANMVNAIDEEDWRHVEIIGWLYQFYISEKKEEVMGKVVGREDIPAATQLFTPNWIVKYLVQNSIGRLWTMNNPGSSLKDHWSYYIEPPEQAPEVEAQLRALGRARAMEDGGALSPESITVLDPACGSGHILVEAYDVLKELYLERGYQLRAIPRLILEKNLYGLDIDDRAAQLSGFALMMKARADDRRLLTDTPQINVFALRDGSELRGSEVELALRRFETVNGTSCASESTQVNRLIELYSKAKTFGSLIRVPEEVVTTLDVLQSKVERLRENGDMLDRETFLRLGHLFVQTRILSSKFDVVVANPPYMGSQNMCRELKAFVEKEYGSAKGDLFACFIVRGKEYLRSFGLASMVTLQNWMFLTTYEELRASLLRTATLQSLVQVGFNSFPTLNSKVALAAAFTFLGYASREYRARFFNCNDAPAASDKQLVFEDRLANNRYFERTPMSFEAIQGAPLSYWTSEAVRKAFQHGTPLGSLAKARQGLSTSDNERFVRVWHEVGFEEIEFDCASIEESALSNRKWFPYNKGGLVRKWYGNNEYVVNWAGNGSEIRSLAPKSVIRNPGYYFRPSITWSDITIDSAFRLQDPGFIFANSAHSAFCSSEEEQFTILGLLNSSIVEIFIGSLSQSLHFDVGYFNVLPFPVGNGIAQIGTLAGESVELARDDWDSQETSWNFKRPVIVEAAAKCKSLSDSFDAVERRRALSAARARAMEEQINELAAKAYGLCREDQTAGGARKEGASRNTRVVQSQFIISYAVGCLMGRYSLDEPGLIYAHAGTGVFNLNRYTTFPADPDGIVPITDERWFEDDAAGRVREFLRVVWGGETLDENMAWLAENLSAKKGETPEGTIRRYLADKFYSDHLQTYKRRPIYWLFTSGKQRAFQALVYLHRYHEGTLSRMRAQYVIPLTSRIAARMDLLQKDEDASTSAAARTRIRKQIESLRKKHAELLTFDEKLRHYADMRIKFDLDDGVKVNYARFGDLVAESKKVTGGLDE